MAPSGNSDTIRILVATDNHVGYKEDDPIRGDDSWRTFHEIMTLAKDRDVDMVLLAGDLFHDNKPSRQAMYQVMRSLRMNCLGDKPCELQFLSDSTEVFGGHFNHVNYEDEDINISVPVFSIHGNHDDPSGQGHLAALDILQVAGLINYYGRTPESDSIEIKPVLLQKGRTKLALYGLSNVRDERLFRTFRDGKVTFFQPDRAKEDFFNLMSVHQNHVAHSETNYLPESVLPDFLDLVIWGHEHECKIEPRLNDEMKFHVVQPGSSVATSLMPGEAVQKHVGILSITGKEFKMQPIPLKTVRPFAMRTIALGDDPEMKRVAKKSNNRTQVSLYLTDVVNSLIEQAIETWREAQDPEDLEDDELGKPPLPLIRLRVDYNAPDDGHFDIENPQRFSIRFNKVVANTQDVVQFYRKKAGSKRKNMEVEDPSREMTEQEMNVIKMEELVREFLAAQSLTILPQNKFDQSVNAFIDKDDKRAMENFIKGSASEHVKNLLNEDVELEDDLTEAMQEYRKKAEAREASNPNSSFKHRLKTLPKPTFWDSDHDGHWEEQPQSRAVASDDDQEMGIDPVRGSVEQPTKATRGPVGSRGSKAASTSTRKTAASRGRSKKQIVDESEDQDDESNDAMVLDDDDDDDNALFVGQGRSKLTRSAASKPTSTTARGSRAKPAATRQTTLDTFTRAGRSQPSRAAAKKTIVISDEDDEDDDDEDAFEPVPAASTRSSRRR